MATTTHDVSYVFIELGLVIVGLAVLARLASRWGFSAIPLYLLAGLAFGNGGLAPLRLSENFVRTGAEIGVLLLLFMLGLEYTGDELRKSLRLGVTAGVIDFALNFTPGLVAGFLVRWRPLAAVLLGGVTYISSSGVIAKVLAELRRMEKPETPLVFSVLVQEDLAMAVYLTLVAVLLSGGGAAKIVLSVFVAIAVVSLVALGGRAIWTSAKPACRSRIRRNHSADDLRCRAAGGWCGTVIPSFRSNWSISGRHCAVWFRCRAVTSSGQSAARPVRRNILFLLWARVRPGNPRPGATIRCGVRSGYDSHEGADRVLGGSSCRRSEERRVGKRLLSGVRWL